MALRIGTGQTGAEVSSVKLRVSVATVNPEVAVSATVAAADIQYILMVVDAFLDVRGLYPLIKDPVGVSDSPALLFASTKTDSFQQSDYVEPFILGKGLEDLQVADEQHAIDLTRGLTDTAVSSEAADKSFETTREDSFTQTDDPSFLLTKDYEERKWAADGQQAAFTYAAIDYFAGDYVVEYLPQFHVFKNLTELLDATDDFLGETNVDDDQTVVFVKSLNDLATLVENVGYVLLTSREDGFAATDLEARSVDKPRVDTSSTSDTNTLDLGAVRADLAVSTDELDTHVTKPLEDNATSSDADVLLVGKALDDGASHSDLTTKASGKALADTSALSDLQTLLVGKALSDLTVQSETQDFHVTKALEDLVDATDDFQGEANLDDDQVIIFGTTKQDSVLPTDSALLTAGKNTADTADASDSGSIYMTDYCDIAYFAEPYVGTYATF